MPKTPNNGPAHGRFRNSVVNINSKYGTKADAFPMSPNTIAQFGIQRQNLMFSNTVARASLAAEAARIRGQYRMDRASAVAAGEAGMADAQGNAAERGMLGSSVDRVQRENVKAATQGEIMSSRFNRDSGLIGVGVGRLQAEAELRMGLVNLALQRRAMQREMALGAFASGGQNPWGY